VAAVCDVRLEASRLVSAPVSQMARVENPRLKTDTGRLIADDETVKTLHHTMSGGAFATECPIG
jgi:hypothetical protein